MKAYTLAEIMVALLVSSVLMVTGLRMGEHYLVEYTWHSFQDFFKNELYSLRLRNEAHSDLSGDTSSPFRDVRYHLYLDGRERESYWLLGTTEGETSSEREIIWSEQKPFDISPLTWENLSWQNELREGVLISWEDSFRRWRIDSLSLSAQLASRFSFSDEYCDFSHDDCSLVFDVNGPGDSFRRRVLFGIHRGLSFERVY